MNAQQKIIPPFGLWANWRNFNADIKLQLEAVANGNSARATELAQLSAKEKEIKSALPELERKALTCDHSATELSARKERLLAIENRRAALDNETSGQVQMKGAVPILKQVVAAWRDQLPDALDRYFAPVAADYAARNALIQMSECVRILGNIRDVWFYNPMPATTGNLRQFNSFIRRALDGRFHLGHDCGVPTPSFDENPETTRPETLSKT
jgi:hypothetical protein